MSDYGRKPLDETHAAAWQEGHDDGYRAGIEAVRRLGHVKPLVGGGVDRYQAEAELSALAAPAAPKEEES